MPATATGPVAPPRACRRLGELLVLARHKPPRRVAVAAAHDPALLHALAEAQRQQLVGETLLFGRRDAILALARDAGLVLRPDNVHHEPDDAIAALRAAAAVRTGEADVLMKGHLHTDDFLRGVLDRERGLRTGVLMSHCFVLEHPSEERLLLLTDSGMNIAPTLEQKAEIALNAIYLAEILGIERPRVAAVAAVELVNPRMPATLDAAALAQMSARGQFSNGVIDGPLGLDNAISPRAAALKGMGGEVAGRADVLLMPDIEAGNIAVKMFSFLCRGKVAGVLVGAAAPVVLTSRADTPEAKLFSLALATVMADYRRHERLKIGKVHY